jgi:hypothetical protein
VSHNRLGFNQFLKEAEGETQLILDTNVVIAYFDEDHRQYSLVKDFLNELDVVCKPSFFSTVTIKSEFLEFRRRRHLTEGLLDLVDEVNGGRTLTANAKAAIDYRKGQLRKRQKIDTTIDGLPVEDEFDIEIDPFKRLFRDEDIKSIKKVFRAKDVQTEIGWLKVCATYLQDRLEEDEKVLDEFCTYLTTRDADQKKKIFGGKDIDWKDATRLCSRTGMGYHDAMILNTFKVSSIPYLVTLDFDLVCGVSVDAQNKTVLLPDKRLTDFKRPLRKIAEITELPGQKK